MELPEVHYRIHKSPPLVPVLSQINQIHTIPSYLSKILILSTQLRLKFIILGLNGNKVMQISESVLYRISSESVDRRAGYSNCMAWCRLSFGMDQYAWKLELPNFVWWRIPISIFSKIRETI
jgi:hypothetical protein